MQLDSLHYGDYQLDTFLIDTQDAQRVALYRINNEKQQDGGAVERPPILFLHGSYSNRNFWLSAKGIGIAGYLFTQGFDIWILEFRGHGLSPKVGFKSDQQNELPPAKANNSSAIQKSFKEYSAQDWGQFDIPAAQAFIFSETNKSMFMIAHSAGGVNLLGGLSSNYIDQEKIAGLCLMGVQMTYGQDFLRNPFVYYFIKIVMKALGYFPAPKLKFGPEIESYAFMLQMMEWKKNGVWTDHDKNDLWPGLKNIEVPVLSITSDGDTQDPKAGVKKIFDYLTVEDKTFICLGIKNGQSKDFSHPGMVVDKAAKKEVWPLINTWLKKRSA